MPPAVTDRTGRILRKGSAYSATASLTASLSLV